MGKNAGLLREFLDSKAGIAFGKALGEKADELVGLFMATQTAPEDPVTTKPNPPVPVTKEVET